jgi:hypothetical protein
MQPNESPAIHAAMGRLSFFVGHFTLYETKDHWCSSVKFCRNYWNHHYIEPYLEIIIHFCGGIRLSLFDIFLFHFS